MRKMKCNHKDLISPLFPFTHPAALICCSVLALLWSPPPPTSLLWWLQRPVIIFLTSGRHFYGFSFSCESLMQPPCFLIHIDLSLWLNGKCTPAAHSLSSPIDHSRYFTVSHFHFCFFAYWASTQMEIWTWVSSSAHRLWESRIETWMRCSETWQPPVLGDSKCFSFTASWKLCDNNIVENLQSWQQLIHELVMSYNNINGRKAAAQKSCILWFAHAIILNKNTLYTPCCFSGAAVCREIGHWCILTHCVCVCVCCPFIALSGHDV